MCAQLRATRPSVHVLGDGRCAPARRCFKKDECQKRRPQPAGQLVLIDSSSFQYLPYSGLSTEHKLMNSASIDTIKVSHGCDERAACRLLFDVRGRNLRQPRQPDLPATPVYAAPRPEVGP